MKRTHAYKATITWTGNKGSGTSDYRAYERNHVIESVNKQPIQASSDPSFRGDKTRYSPEDLLVSALSSCHMLWYLHLCADSGVVVVAYEDHATGTMEENADGSGQFTEVVLSPLVTVKQSSMIAKANELHHKASEMCFLARSVNFPVNHRPTAVA